MSERLASVSARLPPVSRWMERLITKKLNSGMSRRRAASQRTSSSPRPKRTPSVTRRNSVASGCCISRATAPKDSVTGQARLQAAHHEVDRIRKERKEPAAIAAGGDADADMRQTEAGGQGNQRRG